MSEHPVNRVPFTPDDEKTILGMVRWMRISAAASVVGAIAQLLPALRSGQNQNLIGTGLTLLMAAWLFAAAKRFHLVATTDFADQKYLAEGIDQLRNIFLLKSVLVLVLFCLGFLGIVVAVVMAMSGTANGT